MHKTTVMTKTTVKNLLTDKTTHPKDQSPSEDNQSSAS
jgi:hypothetical protein